MERDGLVEAGIRLQRRGDLGGEAHEAGESEQALAAGRERLWVLATEVPEHREDGLVREGGPEAATQAIGTRLSLAGGRRLVQQVVDATVVELGGQATQIRPVRTGSQLAEGVRPRRGLPQRRERGVGQDPDDLLVDLRIAHEGRDVRAKVEPSSLAERDRTEQTTDLAPLLEEGHRRAVTLRDRGGTEPRKSTTHHDHTTSSHRCLRSPDGPSAHELP